MQLCVLCNYNILMAFFLHTVYLLLYMTAFTFVNLFYELNFRESQMKLFKDYIHQKYTNLKLNFVKMGKII